MNQLYLQSWDLDHLYFTANLVFKPSPLIFPLMHLPPLKYWMALRNRRRLSWQFEIPFWPCHRFALVIIRTIIPYLWMESMNLSSLSVNWTERLVFFIILTCQSKFVVSIVIFRCRYFSIFFFFDCTFWWDGVELLCSFQYWPFNQADGSFSSW